MKQIQQGQCLATGVKATENTDDRCNYLDKIMSNAVIRWVCDR